MVTFSLLTEFHMAENNVGAYVSKNKQDYTFFKKIMGNIYEKFV